MLARVIATGKIVDVSMESDNSTDFRKAIFRTKEGVSYRYDEIELISDKIKARVKLTGDIFEVSDTTTIYPEHYDKSYNITEVDFLDVEVMNNPCHNPDYWTRIEHQATIAAMQGLCANAKFMQDHEGDFQCHEEMIAEYAKDIAHALVEKYKEKEERKMKPILDACCGGKMFYFNKHDQRVLFQDIRDVETTLCDGRHFEVKPDVQADFTNMPYEDNNFSMVVFDPPHLVRNRGKKSKFSDMYVCLSEKTAPTGWQHIKYGALYKDWRDLLSQGFAECFRVLKPGGFLIFKWNETDIKVGEILKLTTEKPIFGHISGKRSNTHWICFMKEERK